MELSQLHYRPTLNPLVIGERLWNLLIPGPLSDNDLQSRISRLKERFRVFAASSPHGLWAPGLAVTREMRLTSEVYLPLQEIRRAFRRLLSLSLKFDPFLPASVIQRNHSWLDVVQSLQPLVREANPGHILGHLMDDGEYRSRFLFSLFLPRHYGSGFARYPEQMAFLRSRLEGTRPTGEIRCLDAACGSGEGTYELALLLLEYGCLPENMAVTGTTIEPLELFAAAHGWFPHDPTRQTDFRRRISRLFADGGSERLVFLREDLTGKSHFDGEGYDIILCNGLLGGPLLNCREALEGTIGRLCTRLRPGGILLAADRFHGGWKRAVPENILQEMLDGCGLKVLAVNEGVAGIKP